MDMLTLGLGVQSEEEEKFHFDFWAVSKSLLTVGAPMDKSLAPLSSLDTLSNKDVIALNQDTLGEQVALIRRYTEEQYDIWAENLNDSRKAVAITNWSNDTNSVDANLSSALRLVSANNVTDVWTGIQLDSSALQMNLTLAGHEARLLVFSGIIYAAPHPAGKYHSATGAVLTGGAEVESC